MHANRENGKEEMRVIERNFSDRNKAIERGIWFEKR